MKLFLLQAELYNELEELKRHNISDEELCGFIVFNLTLLFSHYKINLPATKN